MWASMCEPTRVSHGLVQRIYVGLCGIYVGICGRLCVNQNGIPKTSNIVSMWESMWVYVGSMWVYVGLCGVYVGLCGSMWVYVT